MNFSHRRGWCGVLALLALLLSPISFAADIPPQKTSSFYLSNGMQVFVKTVKRIPVVAHTLWYKAGSIDEEAGKSGAAHFLEHLMFKETKNLNLGEFSSLISGTGGDENASTSQDFTVYYQLVPKENIGLIMLLEAERMKNLLFNEDLVENERKIILEERNNRIENNPRSILIEQLKSVLYTRHPYGTPTIGWRDEIEALSVSDLKSFYKKYYSPENAVLVVVGDITAEELKPLAEKYYGSIKTGEKIKRTIPKLSNDQFRSKRNISVNDKRVNETEWLRYYIAPSAIYGDKKYALPMVILSQILGGSETSRLYDSLVIKSSLAADVGAYYDEVSRGPSAFGIHVILNDGTTPAQINNVVEQEIKRIASGDISDDELKTAKKISNADFIYSMDGLLGDAFIYGKVMVNGLGKEYADNWRDSISSVSKQDVAEAARLILKPEYSATGVLYGK